MKTFVWDFFGPSAQGTAKHFLKHLHDFLQRNGYSHLASGVHSESPQHSFAWCTADESSEAGILNGLKPRRYLEEAPL